MLLNTYKRYISKLVVLGIFIVGVVSFQMRSYTSICRSGPIKLNKAQFPNKFNFVKNIRLFSVLTTLTNATEALVSKTQQHTGSVKPIIEAPTFNNWEYKQVKLKNGLLVTLVHDGESKKSR